MRNFLGIYEPYYQEGGGTGGSNQPDIIDDEADVDDNKEGDEDKDDKEEDDENKDEDEDKDDEEKGDKDEDKELARADYKALKTEFPELFKKHPEFKEAIFREQAFTEIFPTVEEAQKAADAQIAYEEITSAILGGDAGRFISELKSEDSKGMAKFAENFLPALQKEDKNLFLEIVSPIVSQMIKNVYESGKKETDEKTKNNIMGAAKIVRRILFGGDYEDIEKDFVGLVEAGKDKKDDKEDKEVQARLDRRLAEVRTEVSDACYGLLQKEIEKGLEDLKERPGLKKMLIRQIKDDVLADMDKDKAYIGRMDNLWKREARNGFSGTLKSSFTTTFMGKAKALIPKYRSAARKEALGKEDKGGKSEEEGTRIEGGSRYSGSSSAKIQEAKKSGNTKSIFDA